MNVWEYIEATWQDVDFSEVSEVDYGEGIESLTLPLDTVCGVHCRRIVDATYTLTCVADPVVKLDLLSLMVKACRVVIDG